MTKSNRFCLIILISLIVLLVTYAASGQTSPYYGYLIGDPMPLQTPEGIPYVVANFELPISNWCETYDCPPPNPAFIVHLWWWDE